MVSSRPDTQRSTVRVLLVVGAELRRPPRFDRHGLTPTSGLKNVRVEGASFAEEVAREPSQRPVILVDFVEIPMPEPLLTAGAGSRLRLLVGRSRDVLTPLAFRWMVGARAKLVTSVLLPTDTAPMNMGTSR